MARLHEYEGKALLKAAGVAVPRGGVAGTAEEAAAVARSLTGPVVIKVQAWTTGRAAIGGVAFADTPEEAAKHAARMLAMKVGHFPVTKVLVEEKLAIAQEFFVSLAVDERERSPVLLVAAGGGTGIEERGREVCRVACGVHTGVDSAGLARALAGVDAALRDKLTPAINAVFTVAKQHEARSVEVNPLVVTRDGRVMAADCRMTIDDYAVFRHPELGIEIARELDHPPTELERVAYAVEQADHRGTFFFAQMNTAAAEGSKGLIGFHGAGGGGSMMSMDAITAEGFTVANFCDTSGNPSPAKVYRAARIILSQPGLAGYFGSGSGVANQEQYWSAYGLAKAFWELDLDIPAVVRLGGNTEDRAVAILEGAAKAAGLRAVVEGYRKTDTPAKIAARFAELVGEAARAWTPRKARQPSFVASSGAVSFATKQGKLWIDLAAWKRNTAAIVSRSSGLLKDDGGRPVLTVTPEDLMSKDSELIACEVECRIAEVEGVFVELELPGLV